MATPPPHPLEFVSVVTTIATLLFGPQVGSIAGPYAVILVCASAGSFWYCMRTPTVSHLHAWGYFIFGLVLATVATVSLVVMISHYTGWEESWMFGPVSASLGLRNVAIFKDLQRAWLWGRERVAAAMSKGERNDH